MINVRYTIKLLLKFIIIFVLVSFCVGIFTDLFDAEFPNTDFWEVHGIWFLIFIAIFPRITLFFSSVPAGGVLWWLGLVFCPRILISLLATFNYWTTNPILVVISWLITFGGEATEKVIVHKKIILKQNIYRPSDPDVIDV